jgi:hypothetical protein
MDKAYLGTAGAVFEVSSIGSSLSRNVFSVATIRRVAILRKYTRVQALVGMD